MLPTINPTTTKAWKKLQSLFNQTKNLQLNQLFEEDKKRFLSYSIQQENFLFDYSKNRITKEIFDTLINLAQECELAKAMQSMLFGQSINATENRAVLHIALRSFNQDYFYESKSVMPLVKEYREKIKQFCNSFYTTHKGYTGKPLKYIVNIGIGGSDLGPVMVCEALKPYHIKGIETYFISNVDGAHIYEVLKKVNPEETLFLIASKTFTTQETMANAHVARGWFLEYAKEKKFVALHFLALSTNQKEVQKFGIDSKNIFEFWDWVGGRFSLWSSIGLSIALTIGYDNFEQLLKGGEWADHHFVNTPLEKNIPVIMALLNIWYADFYEATTQAILPYAQYLHRFPAYLQQGIMESNGKFIDRNGEKVTYATSPIIWGEPGTNGQHAFYQLLHQGTTLVPIDFIAYTKVNHPYKEHQQIFIANCIAQAEAFMKGKSLQEAEQELKQESKTKEQIKQLAPFKQFEGNRPSNMFLFKEALNPFNLGQLIALYEHRIFAEGVIWNIYSYDQWGVELGKKLANNILKDMNTTPPITNHDSSTNALLNYYLKWK
ncbi:MAG: glucose-6-phosphate isomerase [Chitinophagaceae bacterium]